MRFRVVSFWLLEEAVCCSYVGVAVACRKKLEMRRMDGVECGNQSESSKSPLALPPHGWSCSRQSSEYLSKKCLIAV